ncbi:MAG: hypothetical protein K8T89_26880 [Planctomycetes bacterium]|nr:hypothetical protein [Planctomycetota bacterium]
MERFLNLLGGDAQQRVVTSVIIFFLTTVVSLFVGRWWGRWRARREWSQKNFMHRVIVSLNNFSEGFLKIRTIFERSLEEVFINATAVEKVSSASRLTTPANPMLPIAKDDRWFLLNFILNAVAEEFNEGQVRYDAGLPMKTVTYLLFLTCEAVGPDRIRKVRAMMIRKDMLLNLPDGMPKLEQPWHSDRMDTLRVAAKLYQSEPDNFLALDVYV